MVEFKGDTYAINQVLDGLHVVDLGPTKIYCNCCVDNVERIKFLNASFVPERTCTIERTEQDEFGIYDYLSCGHVSMRQCPEATSYCPNCGAKVVE